MASSRTTTDLIKTILRRASIPNDQSTFTDDDLIDIMNEEFMANVLPVILKVHEEYYVTPVDITLSSNRVEIPYRAIGNRLREVHYIDASGNAYNISRVSLEDIPDNSSSLSTTTPYAFYVENNEIVLIGGDNISGTLRMYFFMRPNQIVKNERVATIASLTVVGTDTDIVVTSFPDNFTSGSDYDFIAKRTPNKIKGYDVANSSIDGTVKKLTFVTADLPSTLAVGDFISLAEETHIPQIPSELTPILSQRVAIKCLESMGDTEGMGNASQELMRMEQNAYSLIDNRVEGAPRKVINRNSHLRNNNSYLGSKRRR